MPSYGHHENDDRPGEPERRGVRGPAFKLIRMPQVLAGVLVQDVRGAGKSGGSVDECLCERPWCRFGVVKVGGRVVVADKYTL